MGKNTKIQWCDHTFNPWWGCTKVSVGCENCYAERFSKRYGFDLWGPDSTRRVFGTEHWNEPLRWNRMAERDCIRQRVFCASMADVFDDLFELNGQRERLWRIIKQTPFLDWILLTKRPENILDMLPGDWGQGYTNVWLGTTVENQEMADKRVPILLDVPAVMRFLSIEPMLGPINLDEWLAPTPLPLPEPPGDPLIDWIIVGGETGPHARPMLPDWVRSVRDQCQSVGVPFFFKQWGRYAMGDMLDGHQWHEVPTVLGA